MKLFIIQYLYGYLLVTLPSYVHSTFFKKGLFGWGAPSFPGYSYPGYPNPGYPPPPPPPPLGFGGLIGTIFGKILSAKFGAPPPPYPYPGYPFPGPFPPSIGFPAALPVPINVPVPFPVDRPYPVPFGKPSLLPPITIVKHISESPKLSGGNYHEKSNSHPLFKLFQMSPPENSAQSSWRPMHDNYNSHGNHKEGWY